MRVLVVGALGRMGERVRAALREEPEATLAGALEAPGHPRLGEELADRVVLRDDPKQALTEADVAVDFSIPSSSLALLAAAAEAGVPCVCGTTGFSERERERIALLTERVAVVLAPNFSVAVNVLLHLVGETAHLLGKEFDAEIVELHHAAKRDAPSGTALALGSAITARRGGKPPAPLVLVREGETGARPPGGVGIQALRGGDNPGEHSVLFLGRGERLELIHRTITRDHFARGALRAARWVLGRAPGLYGMQEVLGLPR
jgi:4-hydroxy-tetrahydrodipicolinate reductase